MDTAQREGEKVEIDWADRPSFFPIADVPRGVNDRRKKNSFGTFSGTPKIYALIDPRFLDVRYVGVTTKKLRERLAEHLENPTNARTRAWISELHGAGLRPEIVRLQRVLSGDWQVAEMSWIAWFRVRADLLNVDPGGLLYEDGSGWDEIKREKAQAIMSLAIMAPRENPPPCLRLR